MVKGRELVILLRLRERDLRSNKTWFPGYRG
jgi:hypothetical protein